MIQFRPIDEITKRVAIDFIIDNWGDSIIVSRGKVHRVENLKGFIALKKGQMKGLITYNIENNQCEIVSLDSLAENKGIATMLIEKVIEKAKEEGCQRIWLITTNDNTKAIRFYQKRGFDIAAIYKNAVEESRKIKPSIPFHGFDGIPILHEIEFEKTL